MTLFCVITHFERSMFPNAHLTVELVVEQGNGARLDDAKWGVEGAAFDMNILDAGLFQWADAATLRDVTRAATC